MKVIKAYGNFRERLQKIDISTVSDGIARKLGWESELVSHDMFSSLRLEGWALSGDHSVAELTRIISHSGRK